VRHPLVCRRLSTHLPRRPPRVWRHLRRWEEPEHEEYEEKEEQVQVLVEEEEEE
jgi:hypothetical protein